MSASSQYLDTLTRLTQAGAAAQAEGIRARAAATADAQRANGQIWGQTLGNLGQYIGQIPQQQAEMQRIKLQAQTQQMQADALKRAQAGEQMANQVIASLPKTADGMWDTDAITQKLAASNVPLPEQEKLLSSIDGLNKIKESVNTAKRNHTAELADFILGQHASGEPVTPEAVQLGVAAAKDLGLATDQDQQQFTQALSQPGADPEQLLKRVRSLGDKYKASYEPLPSNSPGVLNKATGEVSATGVTPQLKNQAELAQDASNPNSPTQAQSQAALDLLKKSGAGETAAAMDAAAQALYAKRNRGETLTKDEAADLKAYEDRKTTVTDASAAAAAARQASAQAQQNSIQQHAQGFQEAQAGRSELTNKVEAPYLDAREKVEALHSVINAAKNGNMAAANVQSLLATLGLVTMEGVKRINTTELDTVSGAGSLLERIKGEVGGIVSGKPLSPKIQSDLEELANTLETSARTKYERGFQQTTKRYGLNDEQMMPNPSASARTGGMDVVAPNGKTYHFDTAGQAAAFKARAGIK